MTAKRVVRCGRCGLCAVYRPAGFLAEDRMACTRTGDDVEDGDGCTFGVSGPPQHGAVPYDVDLCHEMQLYYE